jgi:hypothetical protein
MRPFGRWSAAGHVRPVAVRAVTGLVNAHSAAPRCGRALAGLPAAPQSFRLRVDDRIACGHPRQQRTERHEAYASDSVVDGVIPSASTAGSICWLAFGSCSKSSVRRGRSPSHAWLKTSSCAACSSSRASIYLRRFARAAQSGVTKMRISIGAGLFTLTPLVSKSYTTSRRPPSTASCRKLAACGTDASTSGAPRSNRRSAGSSPASGQCERLDGWLLPQATAVVLHTT